MNEVTSAIRELVTKITKGRQAMLLDWRTQATLYRQLTVTIEAAGTLSQEEKEILTQFDEVKSSWGNPISMLKYGVTLVHAGWAYRHNDFKFIEFVTNVGEFRQTVLNLLEQ